MTVDTALTDPATVGPYRVLRRLGAGGMGVVYLAEREGLRVAVKVLRPEVVSEPTFLRRFAREIDVSRKVHGVCTAAVLDADLRGPAPYLVTEYIPGPTLAEHVLSEGPLSGQGLVGFAVGLAEALAAIHRAGVVHRDLTATNVLLAPQGPRVVDFGIALGNESTALTGTSVIIGTPSWMAPEQARGLPAGPAVDVFAWAALVVYAACGSAPFGQGRAEAVLYRIVHEEPTLPPLPAPLDRLVAAALAKDPTQRPDAMQVLETLLGPDATAVRDDPEATGRAVTALLHRTWLLEVTESAEAEAGAPRLESSRRFRRRIRGFAAAAAVAVVVGLAGLWWQSEATDQATDDANLAASLDDRGGDQPPTVRKSPGYSPVTERPQPAPEPGPEPDPEPDPDPEREEDSESEPEPTPTPEPEPASTMSIEPGAAIPAAADCPRDTEGLDWVPEQAALCLMAAYRASDWELGVAHALPEVVDELFSYGYEPPDPDWSGCFPEDWGYVCEFYYEALDEDGNPDEEYHGVALLFDAVHVPGTGEYHIVEMSTLG